MRRHWILFAATVLLAGPAAAQAPARSYAVISEMAREISVVSFQESTGSRLAQNLRNRVEIPEGALDKVALVTVKQALQSTAAGAPVWLLAPMDSDLFDALQNPGEGDTVKLPDDLAQAMKQRGSTHLLLLQRFRGEALLKARNDLMGTGRIDGLGFFLDRSTPMQITETGAAAKGFIAPYVYVRLSMVDAQSGRVLRTRVVTQSAVIASPDTMAGKHPWEAFTPTQKVKMLNDTLVQEILRVVPELVAGS